MFFKSGASLFDIMSFHKIGWSSLALVIVLCQYYLGKTTTENLLLLAVTVGKINHNAKSLGTYLKDMDCSNLLIGFLCLLLFVILIWKILSIKCREF